MKILALELSTTQASLAWLDGAREIVREWRNDRKNSGMFFENLAEITRSVGLPDSIVVGLGPGSYAGVRIAISAAIGLQSAAKARLLAYPSICAMQSDADDYVVVGDARRRSFFYARVSKRELIGDFQLFEEADLKEKIEKLEPNMPVLSSDALPQFGRVRVCHPSAMVLGQLGCDPQRNFSPPPLEPIYLREPHITKPKQKIVAG